MQMDPCELSPSYVRSIAPYHPAKPISELAPSSGCRKRASSSLLPRNPRGIGRAPAPRSTRLWLKSRATRTATATTLKSHSAVAMAF